MTYLLIDEVGLKPSVTSMFALGQRLSEGDIIAACHHYRLTTFQAHVADSGLDDDAGQPSNNGSSLTGKFR